MKWYIAYLAFLLQTYSFICTQKMIKMSPHGIKCSFRKQSYRWRRVYTEILTAVAKELHKVMSTHRNTPT